ncbi:MAG: transporter substrate-binding domain-containing protein [Candidatus Binatia bacterium]|nr:transporter substrate-binding domain-containing protein [Candidatus Binatia bacterium]
MLVLSSLGRFSFAEEPTPLRVCLLEDNLPYAARQPESGFDLETARAIAAGLQRPLIPVWVKHSRSIDELTESDLPLRRLARHECDAILSVPGQEAIQDVPKLALGRPYYGAAFELLGRDGGVPPRLEAFRERPVAVQAQTIADFVLHAHKVPVRTFFSVEAALLGVVQGEAEAALVWGPTAGWYLRTHPAVQLSFVTGYEPPAAVRWNAHVATREDDAGLREAIDTVLAQLSADGTLQTLMARYGIPPHAPFDSTYSLAEIEKLRQ